MATREELCARMNEALGAFLFEGRVTEAVPYGSGHINDTFLVLCGQPGGNVRRYILQRMNHEVFKSPAELMENISNVTGFLRKKIEEIGGDPDRETLTVVKTRDGDSYFKDSIGSFWRAYYFIEGADCFDQVKSPGDFFEAALAFGHFQKLLSDYDAESLYETIPNFHNTPDRYRKLMEAVDADICGRAAGVREEIEFVKARERDTRVFETLLKEGRLPLRVTHNDTKLNNIMIDRKTGKGVCVIDLDTVMPGFSMNDFGDSIRFGASTGAEDEQDLSKVEIDLNLFETYTKGFLEGCDHSLTAAETELLPMGAKMMALECGIRFLTDYLQGDTYFKIHRDGHNLDRCRTQFKLVRDMEKKWADMDAVIDKYQ